MTIVTDLACNFRLTATSVNRWTVIRPYWIQDSSRYLTDAEIGAELARVGLERFIDLCLKVVHQLESGERSE